MITKLNQWIHVTFMDFSGWQGQLSQRRTARRRQRFLLL